MATKENITTIFENCLMFIDPIKNNEAHTFVKVLQKEVEELIETYEDRLDELEMQMENHDDWSSDLD